MPQPNKPTFKETLITLAERSDYLVRVSCCGVRHYRVDEVAKVLGNIRVVDLGRHMSCEKCGGREYLSWTLSYPSASERASIRVRRLVRIDTIKRPVWRDE
jgi:hypothetical protein